MQTPSPFEKIAGFDRLVHDPARRAILTALAACRDVAFSSLREMTGLTKGNLGSHLKRLTQRGLVHTERRLVANMPETRVRLTALGRRRVHLHLDSLARVRVELQSWSPSALKESEAGMAAWDVESVAPIFPSNDVSEAVRYFAGTLAFDVDFVWDGPPAYAGLTIGEASVHLRWGQDDGGPLPRASASFFLRNVDEYHAHVARGGAQIVTPIGDRPYGMRDFTLETPEGHRLVFGQPTIK